MRADNQAAIIFADSKTIKGSRLGLFFMEFALDIHCTMQYAHDANCLRVVLNEYHVIAVGERADVFA